MGAIGRNGRKIGPAHHAEHVSEVGAGAHLDVLDDVAEDLPALDDAVLQHEEAFFEEDDVGRLLGDVDRGVDGDAHVGRLHREHIVDAVAHEADDVPLGPQRLDDLLLLVGREPGQHIGFIHRAGEGRLVERGQLGADQDLGDGRA